MPPIPGTLGAVATPEDDDTLAVSPTFDPSRVGTPVTLGPPPVYDPLAEIDRIIRAAGGNAATPKAKAPATTHPKPKPKPAAPPKDLNPLADIDALIAGVESTPAPSPAPSDAARGRQFAPDVRAAFDAHVAADTGVDANGVPTLIPGVSVDGKPTHVPGINDHLVAPVAPQMTGGLAPPVGPRRPVGFPVTPPAVPPPRRMGRLGSAKTGGIATEPATFPNPLDAVSGVVQGAFGTFQAAPAAVGEQLFGTLPGHEGEPDTFLGRLKAHAEMILTGHGGEVEPFNLGNPPDTVHMPTEAEQLRRAEAGLPPAKPYVKSHREQTTEEVARRGMNLLAQVVTNPVAVAAGGVEGIGGDILAAAFTADGINTAAKVASDPRATDADVASALLSVGLQTFPLATRAALGVTDATLAQVGKQTRAAILATKLRNPNLTRSLQETAHAGVHAPAEVMEVIGGQEQPPPVGETLGEVVGTTLAPEPRPINYNQGRDRMVPLAQEEPTAPAEARTPAAPDLTPVPELGPDAMAGPVRPAPVPTPRTDAEEAEYERLKAERARMAAGFKQTSPAAQDNAKMAALADVDRVLAEHGVEPSVPTVPSTAAPVGTPEPVAATGEAPTVPSAPSVPSSSKPIEEMSDEELEALAAGVGEDLKAKARTVETPKTLESRPELADIDKVLEAHGTPQLPPAGGGTTYALPSFVTQGRGKSDWTEIGKNASGQTLYEDQRGVRSFIENGARYTEPVGMRPTRGGMQFSVDRESNPEYRLASVHPTQEGKYAIEEGQQPGSRVGEHSRDEGVRVSTEAGGGGGVEQRAGTSEQPASAQPQHKRPQQPASTPEPRPLPASEEKPVEKYHATQRGVAYEDMTDAEVRELFDEGTGNEQALAAAEMKRRHETTAPTADAAVTRNATRSSVEVRFPKKPEREVLDQLKRAGFRWAKGNQVWYKKAGSHEIQAVQDRAARIVHGTPTPVIQQREDGSQVIQAPTSEIAAPDGFRLQDVSEVTDTEEARVRGGRYTVVAQRISPFNSERGYGNTPNEAREDALRRVGARARPEPTTEIRDLSELKPGDRVTVEGKGVGTVLDPTTTDGGTRLRVKLDTGGPTVYPLGGISRAPAEPAPKEEPKSEKRQALEEERARLRAQLKQQIADLKKDLGQTVGASVGVVNPETILKAMKILRTYGQLGINAFEDIVTQFQEDWGPTARSMDGVLEAAWKRLKGEDRTVTDVLGEAVAERQEEAQNEPGVEHGTENRPLAGGEEGASRPVRRGSRRAGRPSGDTGAGSGAEARPESGSGEGTQSAGTVSEPGGGARGDPALAPSLYTITDADAIGTGSARERVSRNLAAIRIVKQLVAEDRPASADEQRILVKYVGWGGLPRIFEPWKYDEEAKDNSYWQAQHTALKGLLEDEEYRRAANSTQNAHYTSPTVIKSMWDAVRRLGVRDGSVLEPSAGIGHFVGLAPEDLRSAMTFALVEKDPLTASIAATLYPAAFTQKVGFEKAQLPSGHFTLAISNVPFGKIPITDEAFEGPTFMRRRIHNYFFAKSLDKVAPGGLVAFITTHGTLDATDSDRVRQYLASRADLLGAIRLPDTAFKANAGTEVVTDILFLRKRHEGEAPNHAGPWMASNPVSLPNKDGQPIEQHVNEYFLAHPEMVLGTHTSTGKMRRADAYNVEPTGDLAEQLQTAIDRLPANVINTTPPASELTSFQQTLPPAGSRPFEYLIHEDQLAQVVDGKVTPVEMSGADEARIRHLLPVREALRNVYDAMASDASDADVAAAQKQLTKVYDAFVKKHGYISEDANWRAFHEDPDLPLLLSLEDYDTERETATKTAIFTQRTMRAVKEARSADSPEQALHLTLGERGRIDLDRAGNLLGVSPEDAATQLEASGLIINTPAGWQLPGRYLSGNVRVKLAEAEAAAKLDPKYQNAVDQLKGVIPRDLKPHEISVRLGAPWVTPDLVTDFIGSIVNTQNLKWTVTYSPFDAKWSIDGKAGDHSSSFQTTSVDTKTLLLAALNDRRLTVRTPATKDVPSRVDKEATALARQKREDLHNAFAEWLFNDDKDRRDTAVKAYNDRFRAYVEPKVDGSYLTFPGMAEYWRSRIRSHQRDGIARGLQFGNTLAAWVVGAGKSLWMAGLGMELRRLGLARKPLFVVPNHLISQAPSEFLQYYPNAKLLVTRPEDLEKDNRMRFTARIASGDWDGVIMPYSAFVRVSMSPEAESAYHQEMVDEIEQAIIEAWRDARENEVTKGGRGRGRERTPPSVKQLENMRDRIQAKLDKLANRPKDDMLSFEQLGVDALLVDEAHSFKNLYFHTRQQAAGIPSDNDAQRATDLYLKVRHLNKLTNYRNVFLATGTPVSNSMAEIYVMQKLLQEQTLKQAGIESFDAWLQQFGLITTEMELDPSGTGMAARNRLSRFRNLPDLADMFRQVADVKMIDDLPEIKAARPPLKGDAIETVAIPATQEQLVYLDLLKHRADDLDPRARYVDNMAKITADGRMSSLDMRLLDRRTPDNAGNKLHRVAEEVGSIYHEWKEKKGTQLIFMDSGTPGSEVRPAMKEVWDPNAGARVKRPLTPEEKNRGFDLYNDLKKKLVKQGIPASQIAFIHDIDDVPKKQQDAARKALFRKVREGQIRVLVGSSGKMGTGMNVQDRLVAEHNIDPTYKPSETEQRMGRILRQGNLFSSDPKFAVRILSYVTQGAGNKFGFDSYMWQLNEAKAKIIADFFKGNLTERDLKLDLDQTVLTAGEMKAIATGNPLVIELAKAEAEADRMRLVKRGYEEQAREARWSRDSQARQIALYETMIARAERMADVVQPRGETLTATFKGQEEPLEGPKAIGEFVLQNAKTLTTADASTPGRMSAYEAPRDIGEMRGLRIYLTGSKDGTPYVQLRHPEDTQRYGESDDFERVQQALLQSTADEDAPGGLEWVNPQTVVQQLSRSATQLEQQAKAYEEYKAEAQQKLDRFDQILKDGFAQQKEYDAAIARVEQIQAALGVGKEQQVESEPIADEDGGDEGGEAMAAPLTAPAGKFGAPPPVGPPPAAAPPGGFVPPQLPPLPEEAGMTHERGRGLSFAKAVRAIREALHPEGLGPEARGTAGVVAEQAAWQRREEAQLREKFQPVRDAFQTMTPEASVRAWDAFEHGRSTGDPALDRALVPVRSELDRLAHDIVALDRMKAENLRENYAGRYWVFEEPSRSIDFFRRLAGRRPMEGPKSFLKPRTWESFIDGLNAIEAAKQRVAAGTPEPSDEWISKGRPATYNLGDAQLAKAIEMLRLKHAELMVRNEQGLGRAKRVMDAMGQEPPVDADGDSWVVPDRNDPAFVIYGPKKITIAEAYDAGLMDAWHNFARSLGIQHLRKVALGGGKWGYAVGAHEVQTKFGGPEGILMHEIGHILDERYGLRNEWTKDEDINADLRKLADQRYDPNAVTPGYRKYVRKGSEKIANAIHAFGYMPERMKKEAPHAYWAVHNLAKAHPELKPLLDIQKRGRSLRLEKNYADVNLPGFPVVGHVYVPKNSAAIWRNALARGLRGNPIYEAVAAPTRGVAQIKLGFSLYHATNISEQAMIAHLARAAEALVNNGSLPDFRTAAQHAVLSLGAVGADVMLGGRLLEQYRDPTANQEFEPVMRDMMAGGWRSSAESELWTGEQIERLKKDFRDAFLNAASNRKLTAAGGTLWHLPWAAIEAQMIPVMKWYVPRMKAAATYYAVQQAQPDLPSDPDARRAALRKIIKQADFIFGQVDYANHFMHPVIKDLAQLLVFAPGWTGGSLAYLAQGTKEIAEIPWNIGRRIVGAAGGGPGAGGPGDRGPTYASGKVPIVGRNGMSLLMALTAHALITALLTYVLTGLRTGQPELPKELKDLLFFRDGTVDDEGNENRYSIPGYIAHDAWDWTHHTLQTALNKLNMFAAFAAHVAENRTYFQDLVYNPDDDLWTKALQVGQYSLTELGTPIPFANFEEMRRRDQATVGTFAMNELGINPAKRDVTRTPAENQIAEYLSRRGHTARTPEEVSDSRQRSAYRQALRTGDVGAQADLEASGALSPRQVKTAKKETTQDFLTRGFKQLTIGEALTVYAADSTTDEERAELWPLLKAKQHLITAAPPDQRASLLARWYDAVILPRSVAATR